MSQNIARIPLLPGDFGRNELYITAFSGRAGRCVQFTPRVASSMCSMQLDEAAVKELHRMLGLWINREPMPDLD